MNTVAIMRSVCVKFILHDFHPIQKTYTFDTTQLFRGHEKCHLTSCFMPKRDPIHPFRFAQCEHGSRYPKLVSLHQHSRDWLRGETTPLWTSKCEKISAEETNNSHLTLSQKSFKSCCHFHWCTYHTLPSQSVRRIQSHLHQRSWSGIANLREEYHSPLSASHQEAKSHESSHGTINIGTATSSEK